MNDLLYIKRYIDAHGIGCAIVGDHVAVSVLWTSKNLAGEERFRETTERVRSLDEARRVIGSEDAAQGCYRA